MHMCIYIYAYVIICVYIYIYAYVCCNEENGDKPTGFYGVPNIETAFYHAQCLIPSCRSRVQSFLYRSYGQNLGSWDGLWQGMTMSHRHSQPLLQHLGDRGRKFWRFLKGCMPKYEVAEPWTGIWSVFLAASRTFAILVVLWLWCSVEFKQVSSDLSICLRE